MAGNRGTYTPEFLSTAAAHVAADFAAQSAERFAALPAGRFAADER